MNKSRAILVFIILVCIGIVLYHFIGVQSVLIYISVLIIFEVLTKALIYRLRKESPLFLTPEDRAPTLSKEGLRKFATIGYDPELGWVRKPGTSKKEKGKQHPTSYSINAKGARRNPGHEDLPVTISCYGDSFAFARQVNDNETWEWFLSTLTKSNVLNFGVGNYGFDQSLLRLEREFSSNLSKIVVMGVVPSTIVRIMSTWKHYHEYGNTFGFKPQFQLKEGELVLHKNPIDTMEKYENYVTHLPAIQQRDYFYEHKFQHEMNEFPYLLSVLSSPLRMIPLLGVFSGKMLFGKYRSLKKREKVTQSTIPSTQNTTLERLQELKLRFSTPSKVTLFRTKEATDLLTALVARFTTFCENHDATPLILWMPQKDDLIYIKRHGVFYQQWLNHIKSTCTIADLTEPLRSHKDVSKIFTNDNADGGHYSVEGNKLVADVVYEKVKSLL